MAAVAIPKNVLVNVNSAGYVTNATDSASDLAFAGVSYEAKDNSGGNAGDLSIRVMKTGEFTFTFSGTASQATVGLPVYALYNGTVALAATTTNDILVGYVTEFIDASTVRVRIDLAAH
jgi:hypothetical protein